MKKIDLGQSITILANLGVIAGIALLAYELRQNNEFLRAQANFNVLQNRTGVFISTMLGGDTLPRLIAKQNRGEALEDHEKLQLDVYQRWHFTNWEWEYRELLAGRLAREDLPLYAWREAMYVGIPVNGGLLGFWETNKANYAPDFAQFIDENVVEPGFP